MDINSKIQTTGECVNTFLYAFCNLTWVVDRLCEIRAKLKVIKGSMELILPALLL